MPVTDLRRQTSAVIRSVQKDGDVVYITQHGRPTAVLVDYERFEAMLALEQRSQTWPQGYFDETYGALADDPLARPEQGEFEERESIG